MQMDVVDELNVFNSTFEPMDYSIFYNKHLNNPERMDIPVRSIQIDGKIAGISGFDRVLFNLDGKKTYAVQVGDSAILPECRGQGLYTRLLKESEQDVQEEAVTCGFAFPNENSVGGFCKVGWKLLGNYHNYYKVVSLRRRFISMMDQESMLLGHQVKCRKQYCLSDAFLSEMNQSIVCGVRRSKNYYQWRIDDNPACEFYYVTIADQEQERALFICMLQKKRGIILCRVVDWYLSETSRNNHRGAYIHILEQVVRKSCNIINFSFVNQERGEDVLLRKEGYFGKPNQKIPQLVFKEYAREEQNAFMRQMYFREMDMDTIFNYKLSV